MPEHSRGKKLVLFTDLRHIRCGEIKWETPEGEVFGVDHPPESEVELYARQERVPYGVRLVAQPASKTEPISIRKPGPYRRIIYDQGVYRSWHMQADGEMLGGSDFPSETPPKLVEICYIESKDGYQWSEPKRSSLKVSGQRRFVNQTFFIDPVAPPEERYKMVYMAIPPKDLGARLLAEYLKLHKRYRDPRISAQRPLCLFAAVSPDGLAWKPIEKPLMMHYADTDNTFCYDRENGKYVFYTRMWRQGRRWVGRAEADDFYDWGPIEPIIWARLDDPVDYDVYTNAYTEYPGAPEYRFMFPTFYHRYTERSDVRMYSSEDGIAWNRIPGGPVIPAGEPGEWDSEWLWAYKDLVPLGAGRVAIFFQGTPYPHKYPRSPEVIGAGFRAWAWWPEGRLCAVKADREGEFWTYPIAPAGRQIRLNYRTHGAGQVRVGIFGRESRSVADCKPLHGNSMSEPVTWGGEADIGVAEGQEVILHFKLRSAELFALEWV